MTFDYNTLSWASGLAQARAVNEQALWAVAAILGRPSSYLDLGCGDGWMVRIAQMLGCAPAIGLEGSATCVEVGSQYADVRLQDLAQPFNLECTFDLVTCIEVAEHLSAEAASQLVESIRIHSAHWLVWTAAIENQGGDGHINCQPLSYWRDLLQAAGFSYREDKTKAIHDVWTICTGALFWLPQNVQVFEL